MTNIPNDIQNKNLEQHKKQFCAKTKKFYIAQKVILCRQKLRESATNFENYKNNVIFESIFYIRVKHNTLTTLTLKNIMDSKKFGKILDQNFGINVKLQAQLFQLKMTKSYKTTKLSLTISLICAVGIGWMGAPATPPFSGTKKIFCG